MIVTKQSYKQTKQMYRFPENFTKEQMSKRKVTYDSTIGKILSGNTKGIHNWYVQHILNQRDLYILITN
jgi:hypothetical protein